MLNWGQMIMPNTCRFCDTEMTTQFVDLGVTPLCQKHVTPAEFHKMEKFYPLIALVCHKCWLVQLIDFETPDAIFTEDYAYFSSYSDSWLDHAHRYVDETVDRFSITSDQLIVELASNDGYLLQYFHDKGVPVLGIEPSGNVADAAIAKGIRTEKRFFGQSTARDMRDKYGPADLIIFIPPTKSLISGTWARTLFPIIRSAGPYLSHISRAVL